MNSLGSNQPTENEMTLAQRLFKDFRHGLATGVWAPFLSYLDDDIEFWFPLGTYRGQNRGKQTATTFFNYVSSVYPEGLHVIGDPVITAGEGRIVYEFKDEGLLRGKPYRNRVCIALDVQFGKVVSYREYFGLMPE